MDHKALKSGSISSVVLDLPEAFNSTRLSLARKRRGLNKSKVAELCEIDLRAVTAYESGEYPPSAETLLKIASALCFPVEFFYGEDFDELSVDTGSFRSMSKMKAPQRDMALSQAAIGLQFMNWVESKYELPSSELPNLSTEDPESAADAVRKIWNLGVMPIRNVVHLMESKGVRVLSLALDAREVDAYSMWKGNVPFVFLNTYKTSEHSRFDAAHELGHLVLHKHGSPQGREAEMQANKFAASFLMPRASIFAHAPRFPSYEVMVKLKKTWTVSVSALIYRLHELGLLSEWHHRGLCVEVARRGRSFEPESAPRETSLLLPKIMSSLCGEGISRSQIARALRLPTVEIEALLFGLAIAGIDGGNIRSNRPKAVPKLERVK